MIIKETCVGHTLIINDIEKLRDIFGDITRKSTEQESFELRTKKDIKRLLLLCESNSINEFPTEKIIVVELLMFLSLFKQDREISIFFDKIKKYTKNGVQIIVMSTFQNFVENKTLINCMNTMLILHPINEVDSSSIA